MSFVSTIGKHLLFDHFLNVYKNDRQFEQKRGYKSHFFKI